MLSMIIRTVSRVGLKAQLICGMCVLSATGCQKPLTESECAQLLDHYTERVIEQSRPSAKPAERAKLVGEARLKAARDPEFAACSTRVRRTQFECALASQSADEIERCLL